MVDKTNSKVKKERIPPQIDPKALEAQLLPPKDHISQVTPSNPTKVIEPPVEEAPPIVAKNFFDDIQSPNMNQRKRYLLFAGFSLILVGVLILLIPTLQSLLNPQKSLEDTYKIVSEVPKSMNLDINNPEDELLVFDKTLVVSGKTSPKSSVIISNGDLNWGVDASDMGDFSKVIDLKPGVNTIIVYGFDPQGNSKTDTRTVYYSEEKI